MAFRVQRFSMADNMATAKDESGEYWAVDGNVLGLRFEDEEAASQLADRLNAAIDPLNSFDEKGNALALNV